MNGESPASAPLKGKMLVRQHAHASVVVQARTAVREFAQLHGASETVQTAIALAVTEACANVVMHAYADAEVPGYFEVRADATSEELIVQVSDEGRGMQPRPDSPGLGMGLPLIAQMADKFSVLDQIDQPGVTLRMHFHLAD